MLLGPVLQPARSLSWRDPAALVQAPCMHLALKPGPSPSRGRQSSAGGCLETQPAAHSHLHRRGNNSGSATQHEFELTAATCFGFGAGGGLQQRSLMLSSYFPSFQASSKSKYRFLKRTMASACRGRSTRVICNDGCRWRWRQRRQRSLDQGQAAGSMHACYLGASLVVNNTARATSELTDLQFPTQLRLLVAQVADMAQINEQDAD